jgi:hypothetical protein
LLEARAGGGEEQYVEMAGLKGRESIITLCRTTCGLPTAIHQTEWFGLEEGRKMSRRYNTIRL